MKILHIWNTAGVPSVIAANMDRFHGTKSKVLTRRKFTRYHETYGLAVPGGRRRFYTQFLYHILGDYDLFHVHDVDHRAPFINAIRNKPVILHYHGSRIRGKWESRRHFWEKVDRVVVSTEDLLEGAPEGVLHIPNTVDTEKTALYQSIPKKKGTALYTDVAKGSALDLAQGLAYHRDLALNVHSRDLYPMLHKEYLGFISRHEYFIDVRRQYDNPKLVYTVPSQGALEALTMGVKVIDYKGAILEELPEAHDPHKITTQIYELYKELLN